VVRQILRDRLVQHIAGAIALDLRDEDQLG
jgi:hypothetical protein